MPWVLFDLVHARARQLDCRSINDPVLGSGPRASVAAEASSSIALGFLACVEVQPAGPRGELPLSSGPTDDNVPRDRSLTAAVPQRTIQAYFVSAQSHLKA